MASAIQKPLNWIHGEFTKYLIRPRFDVKESIKESHDLVYSSPTGLNSGSTSTNGATKNIRYISVGIHYRGGEPEIYDHR